MIRALPRTDPAKHGHRSARSPSSTKLYDVPCWLGESVTGSRKEPRKVERALLAGRVGRRLGRGLGRSAEETSRGSARLAGEPNGAPPAPPIRTFTRPYAELGHIEGNNMTARTVLITGGNRGIGRAIAEEFIAQGHRVGVTVRSGNGPTGALAVRADVTDGASLDAAFVEIEAALGPVEVLVANAGITRDTLLLRMSDEDFTSVLDTNLTGAFRVVKRASKGMLKARFGRIVLISSVVGLYGSAGQVNYAASKSALIGMARSLTRELGSRGITSNVIAPGFIETEMTEVLPDEQRTDYQKAIPLGRFATATEVAKVVTWLAGDDAGYISGAVIPVDGGLGMGH